MQQWRCGIDTVCGFIASSTELYRSNTPQIDETQFPIGVFRGKKRSQMLTLQVKNGLKLIAGSSAVDLIDLLYFDTNEYVIDRSTVVRMVDAATSPDPRYTPSVAKRESRKIDTQDMYASWQKEYRKLHKKHPNKSDVWFSQQIAKLPLGKGRSAGTVKKKMKY